MPQHLSPCGFLATVLVLFSVASFAAVITPKPAAASKMVVKPTHGLLAARQPFPGLSSSRLLPGNDDLGGFAARQPSPDQSSSRLLLENDDYPKGFVIAFGKTVKKNPERLAAWRNWVMMLLRTDEWIQTGYSQWTATGVDWGWMTPGMGEGDFGKALTILKNMSYFKAESVDEGYPRFSSRVDWPSQLKDNYTGYMASPAETLAIANAIMGSRTAASD